MKDFNPQRSFDELPLLPKQFNVDKQRVNALCGDVHQALQQLNRHCEAVSSPRPMLATLPLIEAHRNVSIDHPTAPLNEVIRQANFNPFQADDAIFAIICCQMAIETGWHSVTHRPTCTATAVEVASAITRRDVVIRQGIGPAMIRSNAKAPFYRPPNGEPMLRSRLGNWELFLHEREELDPLVRMAIGHFQLMAIRPFATGNGRTARIINQLYLIDKKLLQLPVLQQSAYFLKYKKTYQDLFLNVIYRDQWSEWIEFILEGTLKQILWSLNRVTAFEELWQHTANEVNQYLPKPVREEILEQIFQQPFCSIHHLIDAGIARRQSASVYLKKLCEAGLLQEQRFGRDKVFINHHLLHLLTNGNLPSLQMIAPAGPLATQAR